MQDYSFGLWLSIPLAAIGWLIEVVLIRRVYKRELPEQLLLVKTSVPLPVCLMVSMVTAGLFALVIGYFCVRLTGIYFAILTMAFGQLLYYIIYMLINFVVAGMFAGLAGGLLGPFNRSIAPDLCNWHQSGVPVFMTVIGGPLGFFGPMIGSVIYTFLFAFVTGFTEYWPLTIGLIIIFVVLYVPGGVLGLSREKWKTFKSSRYETESSD
jgi:ABC-type branched-subunit amino acid transport system permease subunit